MLSGVVPSFAAGGVQFPGAAEFEVCGSCHGTRGQGTVALGAPRIAGLDAAYVARQLADFRDGRRGDGDESSPGAQMAAIAKTVEPAADARVAAFVAALPEVAMDRTVGGNAANGERLFVVCVACHGPAARGSADTGAPRLAGMSDWYLLRQLYAYRDGSRRPGSGAVAAAMPGMAATLKNDAEIRDVVAYVSSLPPAAGSTP